MGAYRPDVDGLRALSVVAVILYHADTPGFTGGFVGVDVFFVISGYLITRLLIGSSPDSLALRLRTFYLRRARRILPALVVMLFVVTATAWYWFLPADLEVHGEYLALNAVMLGNLAAYTDFGYFAEGAALRPLLHLWSIAVEEQFYLLYPVALLLIVRLWPRRLRTILACLAALSLALCVYASWRMPVANFYLAPTRAWELLSGALLALGALPQPRGRVAREICSALALLALLATVTLMRPTLPYPGLLTILVSVATLLLLADGGAQPTRVTRLLSVRPVVFVGLISYSLYLWHAPIFTFLRYCLLDAPTSGQLVLASVATFAVATLSFKLVEQPVRSARALRSDRSFVTACVLSLLSLLAIGAALLNSRGVPSRFPPSLLRLTSFGDLYDPTATRCLGRTPAEIDAGDLCRFGPAGSTRSSVVLWGDSHALALFPAYEERANRDGFALYFAGRPMCRPLFVETPSLPELTISADCALFNEAMARAVARLEPDVVILNAFWMYAVPRPLFANERNAAGRGAAFENALHLTEARLARATGRLCVLKGTPLFARSAPRALAMAQLRGIDRAALRLPRTVADTQQADIDEAIGRAARDGYVVAASPRDALCDAEYCDIERDGVPLYTDDHHLSGTGARRAGQALDLCFQGLGEPQGIR